MIYLVGSVIAVLLGFLISWDNHVMQIEKCVKNTMRCPVTYGMSVMVFILWSILYFLFCTFILPVSM